MPSFRHLLQSAFAQARPLRLGFWATLAAACITGCGEKPSPAPATAKRSPPAAEESRTAAEPAPELAVSIDATGRKWIAPGVPYDVFPDLPSEEEIAAAASIEPAAESMPAAAAEPASEALASTDRPASATAVPLAEPAPPESESSTGTSSWKEILPRELLLNEVASLRNEIGEGLLTVGNYNEAFEQISNHAWVMSALATIVSASAEEISWKGNALLARDTAVKLAGAASGRGRQSFNEAAASKEELFAIFDNNTPPGLPEPDPAASLEETADRAALMTRMQSAFDRLKTFASSEDELTKNAATATQDARVLAALAKFTSHKDYSGAANADYQEFAKVLVDGGMEMAKAAGAQDAATFTTELDRIGAACNNCHLKYRLNSN